MDKLRRLLSIAVSLLAATALQACGGGSNGGFLGEVAANGSLACAMFPSTCQTSTVVSGTAATGGPLSGVTVVLKDAANRTRSTTTGASGAFSIDAAGLTPPFVLQATTSTGATLYGVSSDAAGTATTNVTPVSDLVGRSWYFVQGIATDTAFANLVTAPPPDPPQAA